MTTETYMIGSYVFTIGIVVSLMFLFALWLEMLFPAKANHKNILEGFALHISLSTLGFGITFQIAHYFL